MSCWIWNWYLVFIIWRARTYVTRSCILQNFMFVAAWLCVCWSRCNPKYILIIMFVYKKIQVFALYVHVAGDVACHDVAGNVPSWRRGHCGFSITCCHDCRCWWLLCVDIDVALRLWLCEALVRCAFLCVAAQCVLQWRHHSAVCSAQYRYHSAMCHALTSSQRSVYWSDITAPCVLRSAGIERTRQHDALFVMTSSDASHMLRLTSAQTYMVHETSQDAEVC